MLKRTTVGLCLAVTLFLSAAVSAGDAGREPLPDNLMVHISLRSAEGVIDALDGFAAAASEGSANAVPAGMLSMMAHMYIPFPTDAWVADGEMHFLLLAAVPGARGMVTLVKTEGYQDFVDSFEKRGGEPEALEDAGGFAAACEVDMQGQGGFVLVDLGDGVVAMANRLEHVALALGGPGAEWRPTHKGDAEAVFRISLAEYRNAANLLDEVIEEMEGKRGEIEREMTAVGLNPKVGLGFIDFAVKYLPLLGEEMVRGNSFDIELWIDGDRMRLAFGGVFDDDSILAEIAANAGASDNVDTSLAEKIPGGAMSVAVNGPPSHFLPDAGARALVILDDLLGMTFPEQREDFMEALADMQAFASEGSVVANYADRRGNRRFNATWCPSDEPEAIVESVGQMLESLNGMAAFLITDPDYRFRFVFEDGGDFSVCRLAFDNPDKGEELLEKIVDANPDAQQVVDLIRGFAIYYGAADDAFVAVAGQAEEDDYHMALEILDGGDEPLLERPAAAAVMDELPDRQVGFGLLDVDEALAAFARELAGTFGARDFPHGENLYLDAVEEALSQLDESDEVMGFGFGARDGSPVFEVVIPTGAISAFVRGYEEYDRAYKAMSGSGAGAEDEDENSWDVEEEEEEEEEVVLDEPADAS